MISFKEWLLNEDGNFRKLLDLLKNNGFHYAGQGKGDHQIWTREGYKVSIDGGKVRNPEQLFKQYLKQWERNKIFKQKIKVA